MYSPRRIQPEINVSTPGAILFVGRDPGADEIATGKPFVGAAGEVLDRTLALAGLRRQDVNLTNRVPWRPQDNDFHKHQLWQVQQGLVELKEQIEELQPSLIVSMGNEASYDLVHGWPGKTIFDAKGIGDRRGYFWERPDLPCPVLTTLHPAAVIYRTMPNKILLEIDMLRVREYDRGKLPIVHPPPPEIATHPTDLFKLWDNEVVAFDIEITWGGKRLLCIAFYGENMDRPLVVRGHNIDWCRDFLESDVTKLAHNGQFDTYYLNHVMDIPVRGYTEDTSVLHWAQYLELAGKGETGGEVKGKVTRKSLSFLASQHLNVPWWKEYTDNELRMIELCGTDVFVTRNLWSIMIKEAGQWGVVRQYRKAMRLIPTLNKMQARGFRVDETLRKTRIRTLTTRYNTQVSKSQEAALKYITTAGIDSYMWEKQCPCCGGGKVAKSMCWRCAGFEKKPTKKDLVEKYNGFQAAFEGKDLAKMKKEEVEAWALTHCQECNGSGKIWGYEFNPLSPKQMVELLYTHLKVPKKTIHPVMRDGKKDYSPNASEDTLKRVLEWTDV